jgi:hypothetical protein
LDALPGLSVLAWPPEYFHNYEALLTFLGIKTTSVKLPFFIKGLDGQYFAHGQDLGLSAKFKGGTFTGGSKFIALYSQSPVPFL